MSSFKKTSENVYLLVAAGIDMIFTVLLSRLRICEYTVQRKCIYLGLLTVCIEQTQEPLDRIILGSNLSLNWKRWMYLVFVEFVHRDCLFFIMMTSLM